MHRVVGIPDIFDMREMAKDKGLSADALYD
jgi:hypothetical protein